MNRPLFFALFLLVGLFACKKNTQTSSDFSYYGQWKWIGWNFGPPELNPASPDSSVVLTLDPFNLYTVSLNGVVSTQGTYQVYSSNGAIVLQFNNIDQPFGSQTSVTTSSGVTFIGSNNFRIAQLTLFQYNWVDFSGDTLRLTQDWIAPEGTTNWFKRM